MAKLNEISKFLDSLLKVKKIKDSSSNGLQVRCNPDVKKIGFAVDSCLSTFEKAKKANVDLLIVHHGIKWKPQKYKDMTKKREDFLKKNNISLYGVHLPLDAHNKYGNNIGLARLLKFQNPKKFAPYSGTMVGYKGEFKKSKTLKQIAKVLNKKLKTKSKIFSFGKKNIKKIGVISGAGGAGIEDAAKAKLDCLIMGEAGLSDYHRLKDYKLSLILSGHYATETVGVRSLMPLLKEKFNIQTIFISNKTGV